MIIMYLVLVKLDGTSFRLIFSLRLFTIFVLSRRVAALTNGDGYRAGLRPWSYRLRWRCRW